MINIFITEVFMSYNKMVYRINYLGEKIYCDVDITPKTGHIIELICDACGSKWDSNTSNWLKRKNKITFDGDTCIRCARSGSGNPSYGKDRSAVMLHARSFQKINGMTGKHHSSETRALQSKSKVDLIAEGKFDIKSCNRGRKAYYISKKSNMQIHADSILELARMIELDNDTTVKSWTKYHNIRIPYIFDNVKYNYVPDFLIEYITGEKVIEEVKGRMVQRDLEKQNACKKYCEENNYFYKMFFGKDLQDNAMYKNLLKEIK